MRALVGLVLTSVLLSVPSSAQADTPGCVSKAEIERVGDTNFTMKRVHRIFDTRGREIDRAPGERDRVYRGCGQVIQAWIYYEWRDGAFRWNGSSHTTR